MRCCTRKRGGLKVLLLLFSTLLLYAEHDRCCFGLVSRPFFVSVFFFQWHDEFSQEVTNPKMLNADARYLARVASDAPLRLWLVFPILLVDSEIQARLPSLLSWACVFSACCVPLFVLLRNKTKETKQNKKQNKTNKTKQTKQQNKTNNL